MSRALRLLLIAKARTGKWDPRYCTGHGVSANVNAACRRFITRGYAALLIPTSTLRTPLNTGSYHSARNRNGQGMAVDLGVVPKIVGTARHQRRMQRFQWAEYAAWDKGQRPKLIELIGPLNSLAVLKGRNVELVEGSPLETQHDNHVHGAFQNDAVKPPTGQARGIDVSVHQGLVDFDAVKRAGYSFVYVKATEGEGFVDARFHQHVRAARRAGLKVGAYHFLRPRAGRTGAAEADDFVRALEAAGLGKGDLIPVVDVEVTAVGRGMTPADEAAAGGFMGCSYHESQIATLARASGTATQTYVAQFVTAVEKAIGRKPLIYTFPAFMRWTSTLGCGLWIAHFGVRQPSVPTPWRRWRVWQHSSTARVAGVNGNCDVNITPSIDLLIA